MVGIDTIISIIIALAICFLLPVAASIYAYKKYHISFKVLFIGVMVFIVFSQILEKLMHTAVLEKTSIIMHPYAYALYGAAAAAVFEEFGRFIAFKFVLKKAREWKDGLSYGIGHGGIESILIGGFSYINFLIYSLMINSKTFDKLYNKVPEATLNQIRDVLVNGKSYNFILGGFERIFAFALQIALSILVLYSIKSGKFIYFILALAVHFAVDFPAGLFQTGTLSALWFVECIVCLAAVLSLVFIVKSKKMFEIKK